jgi:hypothetical protein
LASALLLKYRQTRTNNPPYLPLLPWAVIHRRELGPGKLFDLRSHPFLIDIYQETAPRAVIYKCSQVGASEYLITYSLHAADQRQATVLYIFPTDTHVSDFSSARFGPAIESSPYLDSIIIESGSSAPGGAAGKSRGADRVTLKRVRDRFLYLRGGQVSKSGLAPQLKSIDADVIILDELDEMDPRAPIIARKRLGHSSIAEERAVSTPTYPGRGIHAEWLETDQREWHIKCESCNEWQPLTIANIVAEFDQLGRPVAWHGGPDDAWCACRKCHQKLNHLALGLWVPTYPGREVVGYHLSRLFSPLANLLKIVQALQTTDETKRREAYNQDLGEPYTPRGGQLTDTILDDCRRDYAHAPVVNESTVMGVDVGKVLHGVIRSPLPPGEGTGVREQRWAGEIDSFDELGRLMRRFNVKTLVVDALPETTKAREFQAAWPKGVVWLAYYVNQKIGTKHADPLQWDADNGVVNLDRTRALDLTFSRFYPPQTNTLPANARDIKDYYAHLKAPVRILETDPSGQPIAKYIESAPDHLAHAENYCMVAASAPTRAAVVSSSRVVTMNL